MTVMKKTVDSPPWKRRNAGEHNHVLGRWSTLQGAERHAKSLAGAADPEYRDCSFPGAEREAKLLAAKDSQVIAMPRERGRDAHYWAPPAQIRTCPIKAFGSHLRLN